MIAIPTESHRAVKANCRLSDRPLSEQKSFLPGLSVTIAELKVHQILDPKKEGRSVGSIVRERSKVTFDAGRGGGKPGMN